MVRILSSTPASDLLLGISADLAPNPLLALAQRRKAWCEPLAAGLPPPDWAQEAGARLGTGPAAFGPRLAGEATRPPRCAGSRSRGFAESPGGRVAEGRTPRIAGGRVAGSPGAEPSNRRGAESATLGIADSRTRRLAGSPGSEPPGAGSPGRQEAGRRCQVSFLDGPLEARAGPLAVWTPKAR